MSQINKKDLYRLAKLTQLPYTASISRCIASSSVDDAELVNWFYIAQSTMKVILGHHKSYSLFMTCMSFYAGTGLWNEEVKWTRKVGTSKAWSQAVEEACKAVFWPTLGLKVKTFDSPRFSAEGTFIFAAYAVWLPHQQFTLPLSWFSFVHRACISSRRQLSDLIIRRTQSSLLASQVNPAAFWSRNWVITQRESHNTFF